jgi:NAD(P)H-hydrate epimerase
MVAGRIVEATYLLLPHDMGAITERAMKVIADEVTGYDALLVGPGLGREAATGEFVDLLIRGGVASAQRAVGFGAHLEPSQGHKVELPPLVLDADALNLLAERGKWWKRLSTETILTPHPGEMARLIGAEVEDVQKDRLGTAVKYAAEWGVTLVLKGAFTVVAAADGSNLLIPFANAAMATAGTGDVLAGAVAGLLAQGLPPYEAAVCGAYLHGMAGALRKREIGEAGMLAGDLQALLPTAMSILRGE